MIDRLEELLGWGEDREEEEERREEEPAALPQEGGVPPRRSSGKAGEPGLRGEGDGLPSDLSASEGGRGLQPGGGFGEGPAAGEDLAQVPGAGGEAWDGSRGSAEGGSARFPGSAAGASPGGAGEAWADTGADARLGAGETLNAATVPQLGRADPGLQDRTGDGPPAPGHLPQAPAWTGGAEVAGSPGEWTGAAGRLPDLSQADALGSAPGAAVPVPSISGETGFPVGRRGTGEAAPLLPSASAGEGGSAAAGLLRRLEDAALPAAGGVRVVEVEAPAAGTGTDAFGLLELDRRVERDARRYDGGVGLF